MFDMKGELMRLPSASFLIAVMIAASFVATAPAEPAAAAGSFRSVDTWITVGSIAPGSGCMVDVSVEVREAGAAVTGAEVTASLTMDGSMLSSDFETSSEGGLTYLGVDTAWADPGSAARLDINIGGGYVGGTTLDITGGGCASEASMITGSVDAWIPSVAEEASVAEDAEQAAAPDDVAYLSVPTYHQARNLSCEYAALSIATGGLGNWISEYQFDELVGYSANPHWGYRGDINGSWGNTTDYGVYAEALVGPLAQFGFNGEVFYGQGDTSGLTARLDAGKPTLVWIGLWGDTSFYETLDDGTSYKLASGYHVAVAYAYDDWGVYLSDPGTGGYRSFSWDEFIPMWNVMDGMALSVSAT